MAAPVWVLSVDLATKTATFQSGMGDAAKSARGAFSDIKSGASDMSGGVRGSMRDTGYSMMEARHGIMMLGEEFGVHLPRGITSFISSIGPIGAAMETAFPFLAIGLGATLLIEHLVKMGEAEEKVLEAGRKLSDGMSENLDKVNLDIVKTEIEIRKLADSPAWDLLGEKLRLEDSLKGLENISHLEKAVGDLIKSAPATSNWNPLNWADGSGDIQAKAKSLQEQLRGKDQSEQVGVVQEAAVLQGHILEQMKHQADVSESQLKNQQKYVDFLKQETELIQKQADAAVLANQAAQGKDRADRIKKAEDEQNKLAETQQRGLDRRFKIEVEYNRRLQTEGRKAVEGKEHLAEEELRATNAVMQEVAEAAKQRAHIDQEMGLSIAEHQRRMADLQISAEEDASLRMLSRHRGKAQEIANVEMQAESKRYAAQQAAYAQELSALDKFAKDYELKKKQIENKAAEAERANTNKLAQIKDRAAQQEYAKLTQAQQRMSQEFAKGFTDVLMRHQSFAGMMASIGSQVVSGMMQNAVMSAVAADFGKEKDAARAARKAFNWGWEHGGPAAPVLAPALGALAFAAEMAFAKGGIVPGSGNSDTVPAMLTPGEGVLPKKLTEGLTRAANSDGMGGGKHINMRHSPVYHVQLINGDGVKAMLHKHDAEFTQHFQRTLRKENF